MAHTVKIQQQEANNEKLLFVQSTREWLVLKISKEAINTALRSIALLLIISAMLATFLFQDQLAKELVQPLYIAGTIFSVALLIELFNNKLKK